MKKEIRSRLRERAVAMATESEQKIKSVAKTEIIEFILASESYGVESSFVREVYPLKDFTPLPGVPPYIFGIINVRGQILPLIDLKKFLNLPEKGLGELNKVIILSNGQMEFGILADVVEGTQTLELADILPSPPSITGIGEKYLKGVTKKHVVVLEAENILNDENIIVHEEVI
jgi:purine-binding chemotaxis protein CheW